MNQPAHQSPALIATSLQQASQQAHALYQQHGKQACLLAEFQIHHARQQLLLWSAIDEFLADQPEQLPAQGIQNVIQDHRPMKKGRCD